MSIQAISWVFDRAQPRNSRCFAVLIVFANFANDEAESYPAMATIERLTRLQAATVRIAVSHLEEDGLIKDTGRCVGKQKNVRVFALPISTRRKQDRLKRSARPTEVRSRFNTDHASPSNSKGHENEEDGNRPRPPSNSKGEPSLEPKPLETPHGVSVPKQSQRQELSKGYRISREWQPPSPEELSGSMKWRVLGWPDGAYFVIAEQFRNYWLAEAGPRSVKRDWNAAWYSWLLKAPDPKTPKRAPPTKPLVRNPPRNHRPVAERDGEGVHEDALRDALEKDFSGYPWWTTGALKISPPGVSLIVLPWMQSCCSAVHAPIAAAASELGHEARWVRILPGTPTC